MYSKEDFAWYLSLFRNLSLRRDNQHLNFVTGADSTHAKSLLNLLNSILKHEPNAGVTIWDLGLSREQRNSISKLSESFQVRKFDFKSIPIYIFERKNNIKINKFNADKIYPDF
jgi:hypothetical protein